MTIGQLFQRSKERISELNLACDSIDPTTPEFHEACGRYEEAKVFGELIAEALSDSIDARDDEARRDNASDDAIITLTAQEYREMRQEIRELRETVDAERHDPSRC